MASSILIIDDDPLILSLVQVLLEAEGYDVLMADNGETGVELAKSEIPNLVIYPRASSSYSMQPEPVELIDWP